MTTTQSVAEQWAIAALRNPSWQRPEEESAISIIRELLEARLTPQTAATRIGSTYEALIKRREIEIWYLWTAFFDAINHTGDQIENLARLAQTARCISRLPDVLDVNDQPVEEKTKSQRYWRDMPRFAYYFSEAAIDRPLLEELDRGGGLDRDPTTRKLLNGNVFGALYLRELDPDGPRYDFVSMRRQARDHFMYALEVATDTHFQIRRAELYIPPAAMWILIAGRNIYRYCKNDLDDTGEAVYQRWIGGEHGSELIWTTRDGFNIPRWEFWKTRFEQISKLQGLEQVVMEYATQAAKEMKNVEEELEDK